MKLVDKAALVLIAGLFAHAGPAYAAPANDMQGEGYEDTGPESRNFEFVRAASVAEIVAAVTAATSSGRPTVIRVEPGRYRWLQAYGFDFDFSALPSVSTTIFIVGKDAATTVFDLSMLGNRAIVLLTGGRLVVRNITISGGIDFCIQNCAVRNGGAALNAGGDLWFEDCVLTGNTAVDLSGGPGSGGAILNAQGSLHLERTTVSGNTATGFGGGVALTGGSGSIRHSIIRGNTAEAEISEACECSAAYGGGIYVSAAKLSIVASTIVGNSALTANDQYSSNSGFGGGIFSDTGGTVWMTDSAVMQNAAYNIGLGGGVLNNGTMLIENSTIGGNAAPAWGGGIYNNGALALQGVTVADNSVNGVVETALLNFPPPDVPNPPSCIYPTPDICTIYGGGIYNDTSGTLRIATSVIANNQAEDTSVGADCVGTLITEGHNVLGSDSGCTLKPSTALRGEEARDQTNLNPDLGTLQDDGVAGNAHYPLLAGSPLIDAGGRVGRYCTPRDQLGEPRTDGTCDVGAVEFRRHRY